MSMRNFVDEKGYEEIFQILLEEVRNVCLEGESGCGKTQFVHDFCEAHKIKLLETSLTADTTRWELVASDVLEKGSTRTRHGIVTEWLKTTEKDLEEQGCTGVMLYWDGFNYAAPNVTALLESLADFRGSIRVYELGEELKRSAKHYFVVSMNPYEKAGYAGTFQSNIAQRRRFETIRMTWLSELRESEMLMEKTGIGWEFSRRLTSFADKTRKAYREGLLTTPVTTGNLLNYARLHKREVDEKQIVDIVCGMYLEEEAEKVRRLWEEQTEDV